MHFFKILISLLLLTVNICAANSYPNISMVLDDQDWRLCRPIPGERKLFFLPENGNDGEYISIEFTPGKKFVETLSSVQIYGEKKLLEHMELKDRLFTALEDKSRFLIILSYEKNHVLYYVKYCCQLDKMNEEKKEFWMERLLHLPDNLNRKDGLVITPSEIKFKNVAIKGTSKTKTFVHSQKNFSIAFPAYWYAEEYVKDEQKLFFKRPDSEITGLIDFKPCLLSKKPTIHDAAVIYNDLYVPIAGELPDHKADLFKTNDGELGYYFSFKGLREVLWCADYVTEYGHYKLLFRQPQQYKTALDDEILNIFKSFSIKTQN